ncbi:MAG TPA: helix-turn-helix transcriptional regulator [Gemmataceae bacterium]
MVTFGDKLKELRTAAKLTQAGLASASGIPIGTIRDYEQGKRDPSLSTAQKLAHALGYRLDVFDDVSPGVRGKVPSASNQAADSKVKPAKASASRKRTKQT